MEKVLDEDNLQKMILSIRMGWKEEDLNYLKHGLVVGARLAALSISKTADLLGFFLSLLPLSFTENGQKKRNTSSEQQLCGRKCVVDVKGQRKMCKFV